VHDDRRAGVLERAPDVVEQRVVEVELPHLHVHLEHLDARVDQLGDVRRASGSGKNVADHRHSGTSAAKAARPVVEVRRDAGLVRVGQRREPAYAEARSSSTRSSWTAR
jgi:hypothetical protein